MAKSTSLRYSPDLQEAEHDGSTPKEIQLAPVVRRIWRGKVVFAFTIPLSLVVGIALLQIMPIKYTAEMVISPGVNLGSRQDSSPISGGAGGLLSALTSRSDEIASPFVQFLQLIHSPEVAKRLDEQHQLLRIIYAPLWNNETNSWAIPHGRIADAKAWLKAALNMEPSRPPNYQTLAAELGKDVVLAQKQRTSLWTISVTYKDPVVARDLLLWLHDAADAIVRENADRRTRSNINYILSTLPSVTANEQRTTLTNLLMQQEINMMMARSNNSFSAEIVEPPVVPDKRSSPNTGVVLAVCLMLGIVFGVFGGLIRGQTR